MTINRLRTITQVQKSLEDYVDSNVTNIKRMEGSIIQDHIDTSTQEFSRLYDIMTYINYSQTIEDLLELISTDAESTTFREDLATAFDITSDEVDDMISDKVDKKAADYGLTRTAATKATSTLRFSTASSGAATIPLGTTVRTTGLNSIEYKTTVDIISQPVTQDPLTGLYYIDVASEASLSGASSRVPINRLTVLTPPLSGFVSVTNITPSSGGADEETDETLLNRILTSWKGAQLDTVYGITNLILEQTGILDAMVLDNSSALVTRGVGNQVDAWIVGDSSENTTDTVTYASDMDGTIYLANQPIESILSVTVGGVVKTEGVDYTVVEDTGSVSGSTIGYDAVVFIAGKYPNDGDSVIISYNYNKMVADIQAILTLPENEITNADILVREAQDILIDITIHIVLFAGYTSTAVQADLTTRLQAFFDALMLGDSVYQSDIINVIENTTGVDRVDVPFTKLAKHGSTGAADIVIASDERAALNDLLFV